MYRGHVIKIILIFYSFHVGFSIQPVTDTENTSELKEQNDAIGSNEDGVINPSLYRTVKKYYCKVNIDQESDFLLFGTKSWTFPLQDVSLTLAYPSRNLKHAKFSRLDYIITELKVVFYLDGNHSRGFITEGGMLKVYYYEIMTIRQTVHIDVNGYCSTYIDHSMILNSLNYDQDNIKLTFEFKNITSLSYQFYLYGVPKHFGNLTDSYSNLYNLCQ